MQQAASKKKAVARDSETLHALIREAAQSEVPGVVPVTRILKRDSCFLSGSTYMRSFHDSLRQKPSSLLMVGWR
jgi:hypothetical protein